MHHATAVLKAILVCFCSVSLGLWQPQVSSERDDKKRKKDGRKKGVLPMIVLATSGRLRMRKREGEMMIRDGADVVR